MGRFGVARDSALTVTRQQRVDVTLSATAIAGPCVCKARREEGVPLARTCRTPRRLRGAVLLCKSAVTQPPTQERIETVLSYQFNATGGLYMTVYALGSAKGCCSAFVSATSSLGGSYGCTICTSLLESCTPADECVAGSPAQ
eukprot:scaffold270_cov390-Prasinococcus_capsulatus_cf.AAC.12